MNRYFFSVGENANGPYVFREENKDGDYVEAEEALAKIKELNHELATTQDALIYVTEDQRILDTLKEFIEAREANYRQMIDTLQDTLAEALVDEPSYDWRVRAETHIRSAQKLLKSTGPGRPGPIAE